LIPRSFGGGITVRNEGWRKLGLRVSVKEFADRSRKPSQTSTWSHSNPFAE